MDFSLEKDAMRDGWVTPQQAAALLHVPCAVVQAWMGRGWLEVVTTTEDDLHEWIPFDHVLAIKQEQSMIYAPTPWHTGQTHP
jgi:hypothetical protein